MSETILSILIHLVSTIVLNTISTLGVVFRDILLMIAIGLSVPESSISTVFLMSFMIAITLIGIVKFGISSLKVIVIGIVFLLILFLLSVLF